MNFKSFLLAIALFCGIGFSLQAQSDQDIVDVAAGAEDFSTLVAAVKAADLVNTLKGEGPFTVFAPTNDAFAAVGEKVIAELLKPENKEILTTILTYHVVSGKFMAEDVIGLIQKSEKGEATIPTVAGQDLTAVLVDDQVVLIDATGSRTVVSATDLGATNGVIHVVSGVLMPKK